MDKTSAVVILASVGMICLCVCVLLYKWLNNERENWEWYTYDKNKGNSLLGGVKLWNDPT